MSFLLLGLALGLGAFGVVAVLGTALAALLAGRLVRGGPHARGLLLLRSAPTLLAAAVTLGAVLPAYLAYEPRSAEAPGGPLVALAALGAALLATGALRVFRALRATRALRAHWADAETVRLPRCPLPALVSSHPFPIVAAVGVVRPRLLVARQVLEALTPGELEAAARHEMAHVAARDNFKALLLRALPDPFGVLPLGRRVERAWREAAEGAADAAVGPPGSAPALELASALLKVARLAPADATLLLPTPALHDGAPLARRVRALVAAQAVAPRHPRRVLAAAMLLSSPGLALASPQALQAVHRALETIVQTLR